MGLQGWLHWAAWFAKYFSFLLIDDIFLTVLFCIDVGPGSVVYHTEPTVIFVFLVIYTVLVIWFCFAIAVFFNKGTRLLYVTSSNQCPVVTNCDNRK